MIVIGCESRRPPPPPQPQAMRLNANEKTIPATRVSDFIIFPLVPVSRFDRESLMSAVWFISIRNLCSDLERCRTQTDDLLPRRDCLVALQRLLGLVFKRLATNQLESLAVPANGASGARDLCVVAMDLQTPSEEGRAR